SGTASMPARTMPESTVPYRAKPASPIADNPVGIDPPVLDRIVVVDRVRASNGEERLAGRLHVSRLIGAATGDHALVSVPPPGQAEAGMALLENRILELRGAPARAAVRGHLRTRDSTAARPGEPADLVVAAPGQCLACRRRRDHRLGFHDE